MKIKKFGLGALASGSIAAAAFALVASPVAADVNTITFDPTAAADSTIEIGESRDVLIDLANVPKGEDVDLQVSGVVFPTSAGEASFDVTDTDAVSCILDEITDTDATWANGNETVEFNCGGEDVEIENVTADDANLQAGILELSITGTDGGGVVVQGQHPTDAVVVSSLPIQVLGTSAAADVDSLSSNAPASINPGDTVNVTVTAVDDAGDPIAGVTVTGAVKSGDAELDGAGTSSDVTNSQGRAVFELVVDEDEDTGLVLTFFTGTGDVTDDDTIVLNVTIVIAGDADAIEISTEDEITTNSATEVVARVLDEDGNPVPGATIDIVSSTGHMVGCDATTDLAGEGVCTFVAPNTAGSVTITAVSPGAAESVSVDVTVGDDGGEGGDGSLTTPNFGSGDVGSAVFAGGSIEQLATAVQAAGGTGVWVQSDDGNWYRYTVGATGSTAFVNNAFNAEFAGGFPGATAVIVVK